MSIEQKSEFANKEAKGKEKVKIEVHGGVILYDDEQIVRRQGIDTKRYHFWEFVGYKITRDMDRVVVETYKEF